jgi:hypothetical protein
MTKTQAAIVICEAIKQAARECDVMPSHAHQPPWNNKSATMARNIALRLAHDQGIPRYMLAEAFARSRESIGKALAMTKPD